MRASRTPKAISTAPLRKSFKIKEIFGGAAAAPVAGGGDSAYAMEELIAELGSAYTMAGLELELTPRADHSAYIASWLKVLKSDKKAIFTAASQAQKAADWMRNRSGQFSEVAA